MKAPDRILPTDALTDLEQSVLGALLLRPALIVEFDTLETDDFAAYKHKAIFEALRNLEAASTPIDVVTVEAELEKRGRLDAVGGVAYLGELALRVPTVDNVREYVRQIQERALVRRIGIVASDLVERARGWRYESDELLGQAMAELAKLDRAKPDAAVTVGDLAKRRLIELDEIMGAKARGEIRITGVPTGIPGLDKKIGGYQFGIVNLLAARPAMGKTAMAMAAVDAATAAGYAAHVFSMEDGWRAYADRALARGSGVGADKIRQGDLDRDAMGKLSVAVGMLRQRPNWHLDDRAGLSAQEIIRSVRRHRAQWNTRLVVVDYVQLVRRSRELRTDENAAIDEIVTAFAAAAKTDDLTFLVLSQLNREVEKRVDKRPQLSDLRGSGSLEERSKIVVSPFRHSYYVDKPKRHIDWECDCPESLSVCSHTPDAETFEKLVQVLVLKNNNGQPGRVFASWHGPTTEIW